MRFFQKKRFFSKAIYTKRGTLFGQHFDGETQRNLNHVLLRQLENGFNKKIGMFMFKSQNDGALRRCQVLVVRNTRLVTFRCSGLFPQFGWTAATFLAMVGTLTRCFGTSCFIKCTHKIAVCYMAANADSRRNFRECLAFSVLCRSKHQHDVLEAMCWALYAYVCGASG